MSMKLRKKTADLNASVAEINRLHSEIMDSARTTLDKAIRIGELLTAQKASMKHGEWLPWIEKNLPFDRRTATNYMAVYAKRETISHLDSPTDAYRLLAAPKPGTNGSTQKATDDAIKKVASNRDQHEPEGSDVPTVEPDLLEAFNELTPEARIEFLEQIFRSKLAGVAQDVARFSAAFSRWVKQHVTDAITFERD